MWQLHQVFELGDFDHHCEGLLLESVLKWVHECGNLAAELRVLEPGFMVSFCISALFCSKVEICVGPSVWN